MPATTISQLLAKPYFSDMADEWHDCNESAISILQSKQRLANAKTDAVLRAALSNVNLSPSHPQNRNEPQAPSAATSSFAFPRGEPWNTTNIQNTTTNNTAATGVDTYAPKRPRDLVETYTPSGVVLVTAPDGSSVSPHIPERSSSRRARFSYESVGSIKQETTKLDLKEQFSMAESRQELLAWCNGLLQLNMTKVEQCGTGAALCQIYDSIFLDLPMSRVKFNANAEYAYLENFKILSSTFRKHHVDRPIPVEQLVKCKMQDNLEFLQWTKRYWDQYFPGGDYDAVARRKAAGASGPSAAMGGAARSANTSTARRPVASAAAPRTTSRQTGGVGGGAASAALQSKNAELMETVQGLERERDFYFSKLRDIELLIQQAMEADPTLEEDEGGLLKQIQTILYSTEEGFEIPQDAEGEAIGEEETF